MEELLCFAAHCGGFGSDPGYIGTVDADIRSFPIRHCRKLAPCPVVDGSCPAPLCVVGPKLLDHIVETLEGMDGENVLKCHVLGLSFQMVEFYPRHIANDGVWFILVLYADCHCALSLNQA